MIFVILTENSSYTVVSTVVSYESLFYYNYVYIYVLCCILYAVEKQIYVLFIYSV